MSRANCSPACNALEPEGLTEKWATFIAVSDNLVDLAQIDSDTEH